MIELKASHTTNFGSKGNPVPVVIFEENSNLQFFHDEIIGLLLTAGAIFDKPEFIGE